MDFFNATGISQADSCMTMYQAVAQTAAKYPNLTAYHFMGRNTSYKAFLRRIDAAAKGLVHAGIGCGDRVAICMPNMPQAIDCLYALNRIGAAACMLHPLSAPQEITACLNTSRCKAVLTLDRLCGKVAPAAARLSHPCRILVAQARDALPPFSKLASSLTNGAAPTRHLPENCTLWRALVAAGRNTPIPPDSYKGDCSVILYSGGTTGRPKGVMLSNRNFNALALQTIAVSGHRQIAGMKMLSILPIFHGFGLGIGIHAALAGGACCILVPRFRREMLADLLKKHKPDLLPGVPTLFEALLQTPFPAQYDLSFLKGIFCGGDSLSPESEARVNAFLSAHGCREQIREGYGAAECVAACCLMPREARRPGSVGVPLPGTLCKTVVPGTCSRTETGTEGEICICGPTVMLGYLDEPEENARALQRHADGRIWLHTGDLGVIDREGFVYFRRRRERMIVTAGYNVYPTQVEAALNSHESVLQSCVIGVDDPYLGQRVRAYVVPTSGAAATDALARELRSHCAARIAGYAIPKEILFRACLPTTPVGKIAYRVLEEAARSSWEGDF